ncbi:MAG: hypothetical protein M3P24_11645, partial [Gemmatimonadota bacterium]|nr:hypothetical protein [Gemmatimonadota bacterium]
PGLAKALLSGPEVTNGHPEPVVADRLAILVRLYLALVPLAVSVAPDAGVTPLRGRRLDARVALQLTSEV